MRRSASRGTISRSSREPSDPQDEGQDARNQDCRHRERNHGEPADDPDVERPRRHRRDLPVLHVEAEEVPDLLRGHRVGGLLEDRAQLLPEPTSLGMLLPRHPAMERVERDEEHHQTQDDQPPHESADRDDVDDARGRGRDEKLEDDESNEPEVRARQGERQGADGLQPEESILVIGAEREGAPPNRWMPLEIVEYVQRTEDSPRVATAYETRLKMPDTNARTVPGPALKTNVPDPEPDKADAFVASSNVTRKRAQVRTWGRVAETEPKIFVYPASRSGRNGARRTCSSFPRMYRAA